MTKDEIKQLIRKTKNKRVLRLDKNFHLYIHGDYDLVKYGEDKKGQYLKVYFKDIEN